MMEKLRQWWDAALERLPHKNYTPEQKQTLIKKTAVLGGVLAVLALILLTLVLFPVLRVEVEQNDSHYTDAEIADVLQSRPVNSVLATVLGRGERELLDKLLYLESAEVRYAFPGTVRVSVTEQAPLFYFPYETELSGKPHAGWMLVASDLRIVDAGQDSTPYQERGYVKLSLPEPELSKTLPGRESALRFTDPEDEESTETEADFAYIKEFLGYLAGSEYADSLTAVALENKFDVRVTVSSTWQIRFGRVKNATEFEQKLTLAKQMLAEMPTDAGQKYIVDVGASVPYVRPTEQMDPDEIWD